MSLAKRRLFGPACPPPTADRSHMDPFWSLAPVSMGTDWVIDMLKYFGLDGPETVAKRLRGGRGVYGP